jgi:hypothetical protein
LAALRRFNAVTVLNGHIHQIVQHTDGSVRDYRSVEIARKAGTITDHSLLT